MGDLPDTVSSKEVLPTRMEASLKASLRDRDGTLVDSEFDHCGALVSTMASRGLSASRDFRAHVIGTSANGACAWLREWRGQCLALQVSFATKCNQFVNPVVGIARSDGALELWDALKADGVVLAVVSNSDGIMVDANLDHVDLTIPYLVTVGRNDVRTGRSDPEPHQRSACRLGVGPSEAVVIEDGPIGEKSDIAAGMAKCVVPSALSPAPEDLRKLGSHGEFAGLWSI